MARQERGRRLLDKIDVGDIDGVTTDLQYDVDLSVDHKGDTPIHLAARKGFFDILLLLKQHGGDVNLKNQNGFAPLHYASREGKLDIVKFLLNTGADPNVQNEEGDAPIHGLVKFQPMDVIEEFISLGMNTNIKNNLGQTPLHIAVLHQRHEATEALLTCGADPNIMDKNGKTPEQVCKEPSLVRQMNLHAIMMEAMAKGVVQAQGISIKKNAIKNRIYMKRVNVIIEAIDITEDATFYCRREMSENSTFAFPLDKGDEMLSDVYHVRVGNIHTECEVTMKIPIYGGTNGNEDLVVKFNNQRVSVETDISVENGNVYCTFKAKFQPEYTSIFGFFSRTKLQTYDIGADNSEITSKAKDAFKLLIPSGTLATNTHVSLQVIETTSPEESKQSQNKHKDNTIFLTDVYKLKSSSHEFANGMQLTIPLHKTTKAIDDIVLLAVDDTNMRDETCLQVVNTVPKLTNGNIVYDIPHFSCLVATPKKEFDTNKSMILDRLINKTERRKSGVFFVVIRIDEDDIQKGSLVVVECCNELQANKRIKVWKDKGYKTQNPEKSGSFMLAPYKEFAVQFEGSCPKRDKYDRKVAFLPQRASFQPYRVPFVNENEAVLIGTVVIQNQTEQVQENLTVLPFKVAPVRPEKKQILHEKPVMKPFLMPELGDTFYYKPK